MDGSRNSGKQAQDEFTLQAPGRWKYFRHLLGYPSTYAEIMAPRHRIYSYMRACSALVLGYHHLSLFDDARRKRKDGRLLLPKRPRWRCLQKPKLRLPPKVEPVNWENPLPAF